MSKLGNYPTPKNQGGATSVYEQPVRCSGTPTRSFTQPDGPGNLNTSITKPGDGSTGTGPWGKATFGKGN